MADDSAETTVAAPKKGEKLREGEHEREKWDNSIEFVLSSMAFCIGLGARNVLLGLLQFCSFGEKYKFEILTLQFFASRKCLEVPLFVL